VQSGVEVAYHSPLPPAMSGVADYSALLLPALQRRLRVRVVRPRDRAVDRGVPLYQLGNDANGHGWILERLAHRRGIVVLHEVSLHELFAARTVGRGDTESYLTLVEREHGAPARKMAREALDGLRPPLWESSPLEYPLVQSVLERADAIVVHSRFASAQVREAGYEGPVHVIGLPAPAATTHASATGMPVICAAGIVNWTKRIPQLLRAFARLKASHLKARLVLAGPGAGRLNLEARLQELGLQRGGDVEVLGYVSEERLTSVLAGATACVNLRQPTLGETSATVVRALALSRPTVVSDVGWFAELPDTVAVKVPPSGQLEIELLAVVLDRLCSDTRLREALGAAAREYAQREHDLDCAAAAYAEIVEKLA
jgi:glycosyltransferase involved in cell wall biosynthesis